MRVSQLREMDRLEHNLAFLATVSNTSPYVGLLGTVWGIMSSFQALGGMQSATIAMVAPGISEALDRDGDGPRSRRSRPASSSTATRIRSAGSRCATTRSWRSCRRSSSATPRGATRRDARRRARERRRARGGRDVNTNRTKGKRRLMSEINVVPYIDVMLVLLIIFMITAPLLDAGHQRRPAECAGAAARSRALEGQRAARA